MEFGLKLILKLIRRHRVTNLLEMSILYGIYLLDRPVLYAKCSNRSNEGHSLIQTLRTFKRRGILVWNFHIIFLYSSTTDLWRKKN